MKCELCGYEVSSGTGHTGPDAVLTAVGNETFHANLGMTLMGIRQDETIDEARLRWEKEQSAKVNRFGGVIGIWDQRQKRSVQFCGACLVERLMGLADCACGVADPANCTCQRRSNRWQGVGSALTVTGEMHPDETPKPKFREFT
jgi:hypothetical protein